MTKSYENKIDTFQTSINAMMIQGERSLLSYTPYNKDFRDKVKGQIIEEYIDYLQSKIKDATKFTKAYNITIRISYKNPDMNKKQIKTKTKTKSKSKPKPKPKKKGKK